MRLVSNAYRVLIPTLVLVPAAAYAIRSSSDPILALVPFVIMWFAGISVAIAVSRYVGSGRSSLGRDSSNAVLAGFWLRAVAFAIDWMGLLLVELVLLASVGNGAAPWVGAAMIAAYFVGCWGAVGQTIGMMVVGVRVVRSGDGGSIGWISAARRFAGLTLGVTCLYAGVVWVAFDSRKRGWADLIGGTLVIRTN